MILITKRTRCKNDKLTSCNNRRYNNFCCIKIVMICEYFKLITSVIFLTRK